MSGNSTIVRVCIIEDHDDLREGLFHLLNGTAGFRCLGRYRSVEEALTDIPEVDVVLMDINLPGMSGIEGISRLRKIYPQIQIIMLTVYDDDHNIFRSIVEGASGYLLKQTPPAAILQAIQDASSGGMPMTPFVARQAIGLFKRFVPAEQGNFWLTPREKEVLGLLVQGNNYGMISEKLFISYETVRNHFRHIYEKLQVHSKDQAVAKAIKQGLV